jgi:integrase/recombinase XerC
VGSDHFLAHAIECVLDVWQSMAARGEFTEQTYDKFGLCFWAGSVATHTCTEPSS